MSASLMITLRETLEASLVVGIILAYLKKTGNLQYKKTVWYGVGAGIVLSLVLAIIFQTTLGGFEGRAEEIYEGITMIFASGLLTWMILWMLTQRHKIKKDIETKVSSHIAKNYTTGLFLLSFIAVVREGIETIIFMQATLLNYQALHAFGGGIVGIILAVSLAVLLFKGIVNVSLRKFFTFSSVILILFAAGLLAHGVHEFQEAGIIPTYIAHLWNLNHILNEKGVFGEFLKAMFGYNGNPSLFEVLAYIIYLGVISKFWWKLENSKA